MSGLFLGALTERSLETEMLPWHLKPDSQVSFVRLYKINQMQISEKLSAKRGIKVQMIT